MSFGDILQLLRRIDHLFDTQTRHGTTIAAIQTDLAALNARVTRLEAREDLVVTEARAAAGSAATMVAVQAMADIARRVGRLEERSDAMRLNPPA